jgi:hypothetical protein
MTKHVMGRLSPLPTGFMEEPTVVILRRLESYQIVLKETQIAPGGYGNIWQISPGAITAIKELL